MPRVARKQSSSGIYHIMLRGNERKNIFIDDDDKVRFLDTVRKMKENVNYEVYAYCLMDNHVHLLINEKYDDVARIMKRICVSYVYYFNKKYKRIGHLFQDRYRSETIEEDLSVLAVSRYIHKNPSKAKIVEKAEDYRWSSYSQYTSASKSGFHLVEKDFLLSILADKEDVAMRLYQEFMNEESNTESNAEFLEYAEEEIQEIEPEMESEIMSYPELKDQIILILEKYMLNLDSIKKCKDRNLRNHVLNELKVLSLVSLRELSSILGISKDIIFRA